MNQLRSSVLALLILFAPTADAADVTVIYNGSVQAELHDCGCKSLPLGGLARRAAMIEQICGDGRPALLVDAGNLMGDPTQDTLAQSGFVAAQTAAMGYSAVGVGPYEIGHGIDAVQQLSLESGLEFVSANLKIGDEHPFAPWTVVERGGVRFGLISVLDPYFDRAPYNEKTTGLRIEDPVAALKRELPMLREKADVVVLLANMKDSTGTVNILRALEEGPTIELVVEGMVTRQYKNPRQLGQSFVLAANNRGKYLGQLDLTIDAGRIVDATGEVHPIGLELPEKDAVVEAVEDFEAQQEELAQGR
jgi:2',3'-cyclic-nucleotide 2'-phosphodiesterase (5'-nucleotidase family)